MELLNFDINSPKYPPNQNKEINISKFGAETIHITPFPSMLYNDAGNKKMQIYKREYNRVATKYTKSMAFLKKNKSLLTSINEEPPCQPNNEKILLQLPLATERKVPTHKIILANVRKPKKHYKIKINPTSTRNIYISAQKSNKSKDESSANQSANDSSKPSGNSFDKANISNKTRSLKKLRNNGSLFTCHFTNDLIKASGLLIEHKKVAQPIIRNNYYAHNYSLAKSGNRHIVGRSMLLKNLFDENINSNR